MHIFNYFKDVNSVNFSFKECYEILNIPNNSDWQTIRKKYKTLIQQCHPDRLTENSPEHKQAEDSIRKYNAAYKAIADYYQSNKALPPRSAFQDQFDTQTHTPRKKRPPVKHSYIKKSKPKKSFYKIAMFAAVFGASLFGFGQFLLKPYSSPDEKALVSGNSYKGTSPAITTSTEKAVELINKKESLAKTPARFFSKGSSLGEVISIQGEPTQIEGDTWYYGKSKITFNKGVVSDWERDPESPLHAKIKESSYQSNNLKPDKEPNKTNTKPYWKR